MIVISSCLIGKKCRYNGSDSLDVRLIEELDDYIDVCPELLGGFGTPRPPCEIVEGGAKDVLEGRGKVADINGRNITQDMVKGAMLALELCKRNGVKKAYLKKNSPTCGCGEIYDGSFSGTLKDGNGIFAELLMMSGIEVRAV